MKKHPAIQMYDYHVWANNQVFARLKELPREIYDQEITSVFPSIADTLAHIFMTDTIWLGVMQGKAMDVIQASMREAQEKIGDKRLETIEALFEESANAYRSFFVEAGDMEKEVFPEHPKFGRLETNLAELVHHVVNHGTYHRGNVAAMIRQQGESGVPTDYIFYLYEINSTN
ncbi:DinB family protein [Sporosarcina sp. Te-1]|uniref:DinB family protein n=1 Tax=Sporosarcina sp. Te-1 TaxID=2818390 RepID=UPI001A9EB54E|nr:DinB family protein [Sporosarcina sp. Te-1]QTD39518.1 DinB family protein [Sporosarcina sp. Te-1]